MIFHVDVKVGKTRSRDIEPTVKILNMIFFGRCAGMLLVCEAVRSFALVLSGLQNA